MKNGFQGNSPQYVWVVCIPLQTLRDWTQHSQAGQTKLLGHQFLVIYFPQISVTASERMQQKSEMKCILDI